jgi:hypothetical protein
MGSIIFLVGLGVAIVLWLLGVFSGWWIVGGLLFIGWIFNAINGNGGSGGNGPPGGGGGGGGKKLPLPVKMAAAGIGGYAIGKKIARM